MTTKDEKLKILLNRLSNGEITVKRITAEHILLRAKFAALEREYQNSVESLNTEITNLRGEIASLRKEKAIEIGKLNSSIEQKEKTISAQKAAVKQAEDKNTELENSLKIENKRINQLEEENQKLYDKLKKQNKSRGIFNWFKNKKRKRGETEIEPYFYDDDKILRLDDEDIVRIQQIEDASDKQNQAETNYNDGELCWIQNNYYEAAKLFKKAADKGYAAAQNYLGICYENGRGVKKDYYEAVDWYRKSADQDFIYAQYNLARCYESGQGVIKDYGEALKWYRKAAMQGHGDAQKWMREHNEFY